MYNPIDPESYLRNLDAERRRTAEGNRRVSQARSAGLPHHPRRIRFRHG
jgi:hypothetical protein